MQTTLIKLPTTKRCTTCNTEVFFIPMRGYRDRNGQSCGERWSAPHIVTR